MRKIITPLFFLMVFTICAKPTSTLYDQLCAFNPNWANYHEHVKDQPTVIFNSDKDYIQTHLQQVVPILKQNPIAHLSLSQFATRNILIRHLESYAKAGKFPFNYYKRQRIPVFIDENRTHCAVGYLMQQSGYENLALQISQDNNYAWVKEIKIAGLEEWQQYSGFSLEELKLIQGAYNSYLHDAFFRIDRYEVPQKPRVMIVNFDLDEVVNKQQNDTWCYGEGKNGVLNGKWLQYHSPGVIWIMGNHLNGLKHGEWREYYKGSKQLCRTEIWKNDTLNGIRKRFNKNGRLIEEIQFKNGNAICKTNYNLSDSTAYVRYLLDSTKVFTQVFNSRSTLIAQGIETIVNSGNLKWFQNIELTALNSIAQKAQHSELSPKIQLYDPAPLVQYVKDSGWEYFSSMQLSESIGTNYTNSISNTFKLSSSIPSSFNLEELQPQHFNSGFIKPEIRHQKFVHSPIKSNHVFINTIFPKSPKIENHKSIVNETTINTTKNESTIFSYMLALVVVVTPILLTRKYRLSLKTE